MHQKNSCYHCGKDCNTTSIKYDQKTFCCHGCKTVYDIFSHNNLSGYYDFQSAPGAMPSEIQGAYDYLDHEDIIEKLVEFDDGDTQIVSLYIPHIHCSSCIWILENLHKLQSAITFSQVNFPDKTVRVHYAIQDFSLKEVVTLLVRIGYEPYISLEDYSTPKKSTDRSLIYKLGIAGFAFGNVMFLSFPEYFEVKEFWLEKYKHLFRWLMFFFSIPVVFYAARDYFIAAFKGIRSKLLNIDVPIALGILVLFIRSSTEVFFDLGTGFFDSLTGLVFFLLLGKFFQQKTYSFLSFERDYKSYFPIAVTRIVRDAYSSEKEEECVQLYDVQEGDRLIIRNEELIPVDAVLIEGTATIDYSFVTGESKVMPKECGDKLFAGGRQVGGVIEIEVLKTVDQSYLTQLWSHEAFAKNKTKSFVSLTDAISKYFTMTILGIAIIATLFWYIYDPSVAIQVFTSVLIIACPCALALSRPFALGNVLRLFGKHKLYIKNIDVIEHLSTIDTIVFDKTGTLTSNQKNTINYHGNALSAEEQSLLKSTLRVSNHPLSKELYQMLAAYDIKTLDECKEYVGKGIEASIDERSIKVGSADFVGSANQSEGLTTSVHICTNETYKGHYTFQSQYRDGLIALFKTLEKDCQLIILSGDNEGEKEYLETILPKDTRLFFNQKPDDKLHYVKAKQEEGAKVLMVGDGLNDAGALAQSNVGIAISENVNVFSPSCDGILDAAQFSTLDVYLKISKKAMDIIKFSFILSFIYNIIGLYFAVTGQLSPIIAAILMPVSSISIVVYVTVLTSWYGRHLK